MLNRKKSTTFNLNVVLFRSNSCKQGCLDFFLLGKIVGIELAKHLVWNRAKHIVLRGGKGMVEITMYAEIQKRKQVGYSQRAVPRELDIDRKIVKRYWEISEDRYAQCLLESKRQTRNLDLYREFILTELEEYPEITSTFIQDHKYNAQEFVAAHDVAVRYFGGRTTEIVYDQDRVMTVSENARDLVLTEVFESYVKYAGFTIHLCRGADPQSKGKIERVECLY